MSAGLIVLDRDGVLNRLINRYQNRPPESPLSLAEVALLPGAEQDVRRLCDAGFTLAIATNQPAAAKGTVSLEVLHHIHRTIVTLLESAGGKIHSSHICFHRAEDGCACRKPKPGLLLQAVNSAPNARPDNCWIVGDRATDVLAGAAVGFSTALVGSTWLREDEQLLADNGVSPCFRGGSLTAFTEYIVRGG
jgi:D-glycero-D-manno-heptose 1,7-bisphosphate phosphatase